MAFDVGGLIAIATGAAVAGSGTRGTIYHYATNDADTVVEADGYFDGALDDGLNKGDVIIANIDMDGTPEGKNYLVTVGGADVTVAQFSAS